MGRASTRHVALRHGRTAGCVATKDDDIEPAIARTASRASPLSRAPTEPMTERTFSILKPDATRRNLTGKVNAVIEDAGLRIVAQKRIRMSRQQAEAFYDVHRERPFFGELVDFMISEPVVVQVLEGEGAVAKYREVMGATNPKD